MTLTDLGEILKFHQPMPSLIMVPQYLQHLRLLQIESQCPHSHLQLMIIHASVLVRVKKFESLFDLLLLLLGEFWAGVCAPFGFGGGGRRVHGIGGRTDIGGCMDRWCAS